MGRDDSKYRKKRLQILRSAAAVFHRRGYHGATMDAIARALGMTKGNLYYYFRDKEEMLFVCHDYSLDMLLKMLKRVKRTSLSPEERLHRVIVGFVRITIHELRGTTLLLDVEGLAPRARQKVIQKRDSFDRGICRIIEAGVNEGTFRKCDAKLTTFAILGALNWIARWYRISGRVRFDKIGEAFARYLIDGLLVDRASQRSSVRSTVILRGRCRPTAKRKKRIPRTLPHSSTVPTSSRPTSPSPRN